MEKGLKNNQVNYCNNITFCTCAIDISNGSNNNDIFNNAINNNLYGIFLWDKTTNNNSISVNCIENSTYVGLLIDEAAGNCVYGNNFKNNEIGIDILYMNSTTKNQFFHNNFIDNTDHSFDKYNQTWNGSYSSGGNYWDNYMGEDLHHGPNQDIQGSDGICDFSYNITGNNSRDYYPLIQSWNENTLVAIYSYSIDNMKLSLNASRSYDWDNTITDYVWDFGDGSNGTGILVNHTYTEDGTRVVILNITNNEGVYDTFSRYIFIGNDSIPPDISNVSNTPNTVGFGFNVTIYANATDNISGLGSVKVNITYPDDTLHVFTMENTAGDTYEYVFNDTWLIEQYNYTIWAVDNAGNSNSSSDYSFNVSSQAIMSVCTMKDEYGSNETINITDPPPPDDPPSEPSPIGYELLDDGKVLHIWNKYDSYYFNTSSGIQFTNHYNEYWSHNVLMLGYYNNDEWNLLYRTDQLSGFNKDIETDNETFVNATLWKDLTYNGYDFRLAIRYHLGIDDNDLTVIPYIKNLGNAIPYVLGFGWEMKDIKIDDTYENDWIRINETSYLLNQTLDIKYTNITKTVYEYNETTNITTNYTVKDGEFHLENLNNITSNADKDLYLKWNPSLDYLVWIKSRDGQYNAPVTLFIRVGPLAQNQEKFTELFWHDSATLYERYNTGDNTFWLIGGNYWGGQSFTIGNTGTNEDHAITSVKLLLYRSGNPGTITVSIRATTGGKPYGGGYDLAVGTTNGNTLPTTPPYEWREISLSPHDVLHADTQYAIIARCLDGGGADVVYWRLDTSSPTYTGGTCLRSEDNDSTWDIHAGYDYMFEEYGAAWSGISSAEDGYIQWGDYLDAGFGADKPDEPPTIIRFADGKYINFGLGSGYWHWYWWPGTSFQPGEWRKEWRAHKERGYVEWDISSLAGKTLAANPVLKYEGGRRHATGERINPITEGQPSVISDEDLYNYIASGMPYVDPFVVEGDKNEEVDLGAAARSDLQDAMNASQSWFAIGFKANEVGNMVLRTDVEAEEADCTPPPTLYVEYTPAYIQSKINNTGSTNCKGYLLMQVQYNDSGEWVVDTTVVNDSLQVINSSEQLPLDQFFNGEVNTNDLSYGNGMYRIYAALRDPDGNILQNDDSTYMKASYEFSVSFSMDSDDDGWSDYEEINFYYTDPQNQDTDGDGVNDTDDIDPLIDLKVTVKTKRIYASEYTYTWREGESWDNSNTNSTDAGDDTDWINISDSNASNGYYTRQNDSMTGLDDFAKWNFTVLESGLYYIWMRSHRYESACSNVRLLWNDEIIFDKEWDDGGPGYEVCWFQNTTDEWKWTRYGEVSLSTGDGTLSIENPYEGFERPGDAYNYTEVDNILITDDPNCHPSGKGVEGSEDNTIGVNTLIYWDQPGEGPGGSGPDFYVKTTIAGNTNQSSNWTDDYNVLDDWSATVNVPDNNETVEITIELWEEDGVTDTLCDIGTNGKKCNITYNLENATWWGDDHVLDTDFIGRTCGEVDGSYRSASDANVIFEISQNDYDNDGITFWQERHVFDNSISPLVTNDRYGLIIGAGASCKVFQTSNVGGLSSPYQGTGLLYDDGSSWTDYKLTVDLMTNDEDDDGYNEDIGVIFRYQDDENYYILRWEHKGFRSKMYVDKVVSNVRTNLGKAYVPLFNTYWYTINVTLDGSDIEVTYNNNKNSDWNKVFSGDSKITDSTFSDGSIALFSWMNSNAWFDDILVEKDNGDILLQDDFDLGQFYGWSEICLTGEWDVTKRLTDQEDFYIGPDFVYRLLRLIAHYNTDNIWYQSADKWRDADGDGENDVSTLSTRKNVRYALRDWLKDSSDEDDLNLVYIFDHGMNNGMIEENPDDREEGISYFVVDSNRNGSMDFSQPFFGDLIYDFEVDRWLPNYGVLGIGRLTFIIEACFIGSFLKRCAKYPLQNRIVMTSTTWDTSAGGITGQDWPAFSHTLFKTMANGRNNFKEAFNEADEFVDIENFISVWGCTWEWNEGPKVLVPTDSKLDDNGNRVGSDYSLPGWPGDGYWAERTGL